MFLVISLMALGICVGYLLRSKKLVKIGWIITILIWLLLFTLGVEVGSNQKILNSLGSLGLEAFLIAVAAILGSCLAAWILWRKLYKVKGKVS